MGKAAVDTFAAAATAPTLDQKSDNNGDLGGMASSSSANNPVISKFDLPSPFTTQELEQLGKNKDGKQDSDSDNDSTKFYSDILQSEENKKKRQNKNKNGSGSGSSNGTPALNSKRVEKGSGTNNGTKATGTKSSQQPLLTSSPNSDQSSIWSSSGGEVEVTIKICDPNTRQVLLEETVLRSDSQRMDAFLKQHCYKLSLSSHSGYLGDISSYGNSAEMVQSSSKSRWTISSLGSTIPRQSIVSIATDTSDISEELMKRPSKPPLHSKSRKRSDGPLLSSTKLDESSSSSSLLSRMNVSGNSMSNGEDHSQASTASSSSKSQSSRGTDSPAKKGKTSSHSKIDHDEGIGTTANQSSTPGSSKKSRAAALKGSSSSGTPTGPAAAEKPATERSTKKPGVRRRVGSASNFPITTTPTPAKLSVVLNTPPPARSVAKIEGTSAKPLNKFEEEMNDEAVLEADLQKGAALWSAILPEELVFARWRDKNYYSGMVKSKGLNDTWIIDFDDGMEDVASESHIVPIRILGVGTKGIYSPDTGYQPHNATVIGQKFGVDADTGSQWVKYAIKCQGLDKAIWCSRRQLSIKEVDAKKLRADYLPPAQGKAGDVSLDNIVSGPRRRTRGTESETNEKSLIAGAFDQSIADSSNAESTVTPKSRGVKPGKKTPASEAKKKRAVITTANTPLTKDASTSSPIKDIAIKESPIKVKSEKYATIEIGKKKPKKTIFQGLQFFLTASGGGDPGISGNPMIMEPLPYDKDEFRELIENSGGEVIDAVGEEADKNVFLISDSFARTVKYIYCLAGSIPCVSHTWITTCLDKHEIVDWEIFQLPSGWSLEHQDLITHHARKPLKGVKIFVTSESDQLYNYWKPVLTAAEATLLKPSRKKGTIIPQGTEVVVTDNNFESTKDVLEEAGALTIPVVKPEWLVQTIITGDRAHMYGHDKYKVQYEETEASGELDGDTEDTEPTENEVLTHMETPD
ncbi:Tumor suppressor p53-binding protein 1 [Orchesella cincta]|uniref:Tumor suppressor p53-binding protein 1 n=1 Tax=Orchesella cincta TaxID=48709 RepID=A0A1D2MP19_ORCCI|nr:Tumor suppressor p53-binding protein 1 [Orchesella cincta]